MSTPSEPSNSPSNPIPKPRWRKVANWLIAAAILCAISTCVDKFLEWFSIKHLTEANLYFVNGVKAIDPFTLARVFYFYLLSGTPPEAVEPYAFAQPVPTSFPLLLTMLWRLIPGALYTAMTIISSGWVSTIVAATAIFLGYISVRSRSKTNETSFDTLVALLAVPLIGCIFVWLLLQLMWLASVLFGEVLVAAEMVATFTVLGPTIAWALFKKSENDATDKVIKSLVKRI